MAWRLIIIIIIKIIIAVENLGAPNGLTQVEELNKSTELYLLLMLSSYYLHHITYSCNAIRLTRNTNLQKMSPRVGSPFGVFCRGRGQN